MRRRHHNSIAIACALFAVLSCRNALATILLFETANPAIAGFVGGGYENETAAGFGDYGDNVTSTTVVDAGPGLQDYLYGMGNGFTPNITMGYSHVDNAPAGSAGNSPHPAPSGSWSDPVNYLHHQPEDFFWMTFTPTGAFGVQINSFAIDLFSGAGSLDWKVRTGNTLGPIIASGTEIALIASGPDRIVNVNTSFYGPLVLEINFSAGLNGAVGIDDLNFDQVPPVPEPSTGLLLGLGVVGLAIRTRRRTVA